MNNEATAANAAGSAVTDATGTGDAAFRVAPVTPPRAEWLALLNRVYPHWGGDAEYDWVFERADDPAPAVRFALEHSATGAIAAGSALVWRNLFAPDATGGGTGATGGTTVTGRTFTIGIMTGSWTLPEARGRGCFTRVIAESLARVNAAGADALTAFVTATNASARRLAAAGSLMLPAHYLFYDDPTAAGAAADATAAAAGNALISPSDAVRFGYDAAQFDAQFRDRPTAPFPHRTTGGRPCLLEMSADAVKVLHIEKNDNLAADLADLGRWSLAEHGRKLYHYTTNPAEAAACRAAGFRHVPGWFTVLPAATTAGAALLDALRARPLEIQLGDKM
ncbi:MAG: hypothetical protein LBR07_09350 [Puniceicoccales bacterium]|nr:hypothetical protein [Puniceicoccales bacterium]